MDDEERPSLRMQGLMAVAPPAAPSTDASWSFDPRPDEVEVPAPDGKASAKVVIFVLGGITFSELRAVAEVNKRLPKGTEVILGGTALLTPRKLIEELRQK